MNLLVLSPEKEIFAGSVKSVQVPGSDGGFQLLDGHAAIVASLKEGTVNVVKSNGEKLTFEVTGGFVECLNNEVSLLIAGMKEA
ncbi:MAG: ATP synthase F1 subunit epsilon [Saprospiraceae bacterium]|nr:ATP synthase F1 subunit epsilon [Saprospiraceae bacterium]